MATQCTWSGRGFAVYGLDGTKWNPVPGVYIFAAPAGAGTWRAIYVGETGSFADRLPGHEKQAAAIQLGATSVHARVENSADARASLESFIIRDYSPPLNDR